jgi:CxxC-x17-CxxC domain-containing protein
MGFQRRSYGPRTMHKATCADCKQECEVPFKPTEDDQSIVANVIDNIGDIKYC